jgi:hypothetical protein
MNAELSNDQIRALERLAPGETLTLIDAHTQKEYVLFDKDVYERWVAQQVNAALDEADAGLEEELDVEAIKREGRELLAKQRRL